MSVLTRFHNFPAHTLFLLTLLASYDVISCHSNGSDVAWRSALSSWFSMSPASKEDTKMEKASSPVILTSPTTLEIGTDATATEKTSTFAHEKTGVVGSEETEPSSALHSSSEAPAVTVISTGGFSQTPSRPLDCYNVTCEARTAVPSSTETEAFTQALMHYSTAATIDSPSVQEPASTTPLILSTTVRLTSPTEGSSTVKTVIDESTTPKSIKEGNERRKPSLPRGRNRKNRLPTTVKPDKRKSLGKNSNSSVEHATKGPVTHQNDPPWNFGPSVDPDDRAKKMSSGSVVKKVPPQSTSLNKKYRETTSGTAFFWKFGPGLKEAKKQWGTAWEYHVYFLGGLFALLGTFTLISLMRLRWTDRLLDKTYLVTLDVLILAVASCRSVFLLYDPYDVGGKYHPVMAYLLFDIVYPCLSSACSVLFLALLTTTKVQLLPEKVQRPSILATVVIFHFCFSIASDIVVGFFSKPITLIIACQVFFLGWTFLLSIAYFYVFQQLFRAALRKQSEMIRLTFTKLHIDGAELPRRLPRPTLATSVRVALITAVLALVMVVVQAYGVVSIFGISPKLNPEYWSWWGFQLGSRILELTICATMLYIASQPTKHHENGDDGTSCWNACNAVRRSRNKDAPDFETYTNQYTAQYGFRNENFNTSLDSSRPWDPLGPDLSQSFQNPGAILTSEINDDNVAMTNIPRPSLLQNNPCVTHSLLSAKQSRSGNPSTSTEGMSTTLKTVGTLTSASEGGRSTTSSRPHSMLFKENGIIRFRKDGDPEQPLDVTDEEEEESDSLRAHMGSSVHTLCDDEDIAHESLSPFFHGRLNQTLAKGMSGCSLETTDLSSDQLSNGTRNDGLSGSAVLDFQGSRRFGSTCSSESAANSFDVAFYLSANARHPPTFCCPHHNLQEDIRWKSRHEKICARSVSPIICRTASRRFCDPHHMKLNLIHGHTSPGVVNASCGTEDITPDSAVYLDLHLSPEDVCQANFSPEQPLLTSSFRRRSSISHSLNDLNRTSAQSSGSSTRSRKTSSRGFLNRLRGSTFSLNASLNGYEPLESDECSTYFCGASLGKETKVRIKRSCSDVRPRSALETRMAQKRALIGELCHGDSGMLDAAEPTQRVDGCSQTDPCVISGECTNRKERIVPIEV